MPYLFVIVVLNRLKFPVSFPFLLIAVAQVLLLGRKQV
ncbi:MAG: hypothetical protein ACI9LS_000742, partial [Flavobacteriales bacterium]